MYPLVDYHGNGKNQELKMYYFLLNMGYGFIAMVDLLQGILTPFFRHNSPESHHH